ncbi:MAG: cytochrome c1 [Steroidobacteraceae bacterium]|nr:cytochrome c1 [Steroidobacteraceae bacterium]MCC7199104.1 cytochrome c1 [Gammaproteobacteria bacterium]
MRTKNKIAALVLALLPVAALGAGGGPALAKASTDIHNTASLQRGARNFVNYCMGCHSAKYVRWNRLAADLQIPMEEVAKSFMPPGASEHSTMMSAMSATDGKVWFGNAPPDLSMIARSRGLDYLYTFMTSFYEDPSRPTGTNNLALPGAAMPHVLAGLQGVQKAKFETVTGPDGKPTQHMVGLEPGTPGTMDAKQYAEFVNDTVNFLDYIGEPVKAKRENLGVWVIMFLLLLWVFTYLLKKEYWKDVK